MQETLFFEADGLVLHGILHLPENQHPPLVVGAHGLLSTGESPKQQALADGCNRLGIAYFRFDHRGCGKSQGVFSEVTTFEGRCRDLAAAIAMLAGRPRLGPVSGLFGSSLGGAAVLAVAPDHDIRAVVTLAAPVRSSAVRTALHRRREPALAGIRQGRIDFDISARLPAIHHVLVCHGDADEVVDYENALEIYKSAREPKKLLRLEGADHPISAPKHQKAFMENALAWFKQYLAGP